MPIEWFNEDDHFADHDGEQTHEPQPGGEPGVDW